MHALQLPAARAEALRRGTYPSSSPLPQIVSVSFGAARDFQLREIAGARRRVTVLLSPGDVLIMRGTTQRHWQHGVPQRAKTTSPRVSLTFRNMLPHGSGGSAGRRDGSHDKAGSGAG